MSQSEFPRHLVDEMERLLVEVRKASDQIEALAVRARDVAALLKRTIREDAGNERATAERERAIRQADTAIEREAQREVERRERSIEEGLIMPSSPFKTLEQAATEFVVGTLRAQHDANGRNIMPTDDTGERFPGEGLLSHAVRSVVLPKDMPAEERAAIIQDIAELSGSDVHSAFDHPDLVDPNEQGLVMPLDTPTQPIVYGWDAGSGGSVTVESHFDERGGFLGMRIVDEAVDAAQTPEQDAPASGVATEQEIPAASQAGADDTGADEEKPPAGSSAPVDQPPLVEAAAIASGAIKPAPAFVPYETPSVHTVEIVNRSPTQPPKSLRQIADRFYRELPEPTEEAIEAGRISADLARIAAVKAQDKFYEEVMLLWSTTMLTENQIAKRLLTTKALVTTILERARADGDERIDRKTFKAKPVPLKQEPEMPSKGVSAPPPPRPFIANNGITWEEDAMPPASHTHISKGVCIVDLETNKIYGKTGYWTTSPEVARTVAKLNHGQMFAADLIQRDCGWPTMDHLRRAITTMIERLRDCSIELVNLPVGMKINKIDTGKH